jgi:hypothetical protein
MQYKIILIIILIIINYFFYKKNNETFDVSTPAPTPLPPLTISPSSVNNFLANVQIVLKKMQEKKLQNV